MERVVQSTNVGTGCVEKSFNFDFVSGSDKFTLEMPVKFPYDIGKIKEFTHRLMNYHNLPVYIEQDLTNALKVFIGKENECYYDDISDEISEKQADNIEFQESAIDSWAEEFTQECSKYSEAKDIKTEELTFSEMYHSLIHSPALETLLQLENTYALAVQDILDQRNTALKKLERKQNEEMQQALEGSSETSSENYHHLVNNLAARHCEDTQMITTQWSSALSDLQEVQKREYQEWVSKVHEDLVKSSSGNGEHGGFLERDRSPSALSVLDDVIPTSAQLEESFTIHLGAQMKSTHNLRLMCGDLLDLCRYKPARPGTSVWAQPQRIQTAMSLYSQSLSGLVLLVDSRINSYTGIKKEFAAICQQSTDFHFPDLDKQFCIIQQNLEKRQQKIMQNNEGYRQGRNDEAFKTSTIESGNFYITRHSNLSQVHAVFHLVVDDSLKSPMLATRHAIVIGLRNILHTASRQNIHTITLPALLADEMTEDMTVTWCTKRAELVFKCVKGFMMECASWSGSESFTIQFVLPKDISSEMFHTLSNMLPSIFRVSRTLDLQDLARK